MPDIIQLLPDPVANQIAAGEVIQRPASVIKELVENAIDAGATEVKVIVKDAGKTLIQVIDNGKGMSETDARLSFARHATSKIRKAEDLFAIHTMGFRGEALASIAAVAQVTLKTRRQEDDIAVCIQVKDSKIISQELCQAPKGTSFSVKNLFYNVPARRNFLKSDTVEFRHIVSEFIHIVLAHPQIHFSLHHNEKEIYHLTKGNLRQRIIGILGKKYNERLVPVEEVTETIGIQGFVGKPEFAKKKRRYQYFFVNNRFIKSPYLNHALRSAYDELIGNDMHPFYILFIDIDPTQIDINVHPTKQEIKFEDERIVYNYLKVATRHALGKHHITPTLDFDVEQGLNFNQNRPQSSGDNHGFSSQKSFKTPQFPQSKSDKNTKNWEKLYSGLEKILPIIDPDGTSIEIEHTEEEPKSPEPPQQAKQLSFTEQSNLENQSDNRGPFQIHNTFIANQIKSGLVLIHQRRAHERILFEKYSNAFEGGEMLTQKELFPDTVTLPTDDAILMKAMIPELQLLGFQIEDFGNNTFIVHGIPADMDLNPTVAIQLLLGQYRDNLDLELDHRDNIARSMATSAAVKVGETLSEKEMSELINLLFACEMPLVSPTGKKTFIKMKMEDIARQFD
ncbi:MAG TPA: DNA mismatch repair endonuclease MutL [Saprospiraceae bacterium]|nr:DNA mismatch repair endonuclease MutL [Saprospiraceae bacterium]